MPISTWRYRGQAETVQHMGPMAQDFFAAFGLGQDERYISSVDADGIALASIQGLYQIVQEKDAQIETLQSENSSQQEKLADLENRISRLEQGGSSAGSSVNGMLLAGLCLMLGLFIGQTRTKNTAVI